jgi:hypothetical protein
VSSTRWRSAALGRREIGQEGDAYERELPRRLLALLRGSGTELDRIVAAAPSISVGRHLWRALDAGWLEASAHVWDSAVEATVFALPVILVVGREGGEVALAAGQRSRTPLRWTAILR